MTPEERFERIEQNLEAVGVDIKAMTEHQRMQQHDIDKMLDAAGKLIVVSRTLLDSAQEFRETQRKDHEEWVERDKATQDKLNILIAYVDRIIRRDNDNPPGINQS